MDKISSINIIHSSTRDYKETLMRCEKTLEENNVVIKHIVANKSQKELKKLQDMTLENKIYLMKLKEWKTLTTQIKKR